MVRPWAWLRVLVVLGATALVSCVTLDYPRRAQQIEPRAGQGLVFGRVQLIDEDGREYFPWGLNPFAPQLHLWLLRLGPRRVSPELRLASDGALRVWLPAGDYAVVGSRLPPSDAARGFQDKFVIALLRVPADGVAVYAGNLVLTMHISAFVISELEPDYGILRSHVSEVTRASDQMSLERQFGSLPEAPAESLWCVGEPVPGFDDPDLFARGRRLLDAGCRPAPQVDSD